MATRFNAHSTAEEVAQDIDLSGKLAVVTGGTAGLGEETARVLAIRGADVVIGGRSPDALTAAVARLEAAAPDVRIVGFLLDLASVESIDAFALSVLALDRPVDLLINNAGIMACPLTRNAAGIELQFATNFVGHAVLTSRLADALRRAEKGRLISLSSSGHHFSNVDLDDLNWSHREYDKWRAYGQSKTACALLARKVSDAMAADGVTALAVHPGVIGTGLMKYLTREDYAALQQRTDVRPPTNGKTKTVAQGAATTIWAATAPELEGRFAYLEDCGIAEPCDRPTLISGMLPYAADAAQAHRLWERTEALIGRKLPL